MPSLQPQIGLRDYLSYLVPGVVLLSCYAVWDPSAAALLRSDPVLSAALVLAGGYLAGHVCKGVGDTLLGPLRRRAGFNPYANTLGASGRLGAAFRQSLLSKLESVWGKKLVDGELDRRPSNLVLLCWYDAMRHSSRGHDEVERYVSLFNFCLSLVPASAALAVTCALKSHYAASAAALFACVVFIKYWYQYEAAFCVNILRVWYAQQRSGE